jgi:hypothetical protein
MDEHRNDWVRLVDESAAWSSIAVELSAISSDELPGLLRYLDSAPRLPFLFISVHAPSKGFIDDEARPVDELRRIPPWVDTIVIHPDTISDPELYRRLGGGWPSRTWTRASRRATRPTTWWSTGSLNAEAGPSTGDGTCRRTTRAPPRRDHVHGVDDREARREERYRPAAVREHVLDVRRPRERVAVVQLGDRARGVDWVVEQRIGQAEGMRDRVRRRSRMDEHHRAAPLQLGEDRIEARLPDNCRRRSISASSR